MEVGNGMMFSANVVDGLVHQIGGRALANECRKAIMVENNNNNNATRRRCDEGSAMMTGPGSDELREQFQYIVHTVPPFYTTKGDDDDDKGDNPHHQHQHQLTLLLASCYETSLQLIREKNPNRNDSSSSSSSSSNGTTIRVACPLLGAGCRGFPEDQAIQVAANAAANLLRMENNNNNISLAFAIPNGEIRKALIRQIDENLKGAAAAVETSSSSSSIVSSQ
jgi:O-acetyl-ADP-ribose deacetylase (regulator of RNase III)